LQQAERHHLRTRLKERHNYLSELENKSGVRLGSPYQSSSSLERYGSIQSGADQLEPQIEDYTRKTNLEEANKIDQVEFSQR
jgi:hypothetical protein